ncbi:MAG: DUF1801 domain-containing protein [bacterium]
MTKSRPIHPDFESMLDLKEQSLIDIFCDLREYILEIYPDSNELLYNTDVLTTVFSISEKMSDAFCRIQVYTNHLNLGFNKGSLLNDPHGLLKGTENLIRHIDIKMESDYRSPKVKELIKEALVFAVTDMDGQTKASGKTISKMS